LIVTFLRQGLAAFTFIRWSAFTCMLPQYFHAMPEATYFVFIEQSIRSCFLHFSSGECPSTLVGSEWLVKKFKHNSAKLMEVNQCWFTSFRRPRYYINWILWITRAMMSDGGDSTDRCMHKTMFFNSSIY
jgi:hypothetical protein